MRLVARPGVPGKRAHGSATRHREGVAHGRPLDRRFLPVWRVFAHEHPLDRRFSPVWRVFADEHPSDRRFPPVYGVRGPVRSIRFRVSVLRFRPPFAGEV